MRSLRHPCTSIVLLALAMACEQATGPTSLGLSAGSGAGATSAAPIIAVGENVVTAGFSEQASLDPDGLLPPGHNPASIPPSNGPAVPMSETTRTAILLFDAGAVSDRNYDHVTCLDGVTFGFGHWPQAELAAFFRELREDPDVEMALVRRFVEAFEEQPFAWDAFGAAAEFDGAHPDASAVRTGIDRLIISTSLENVRAGEESDGSCKRPTPEGSFYDQHSSWFLPAAKRAFRDPVVVLFQVHFWERDVIEPATTLAKELGLPTEGIYLMAFYESNPGQVSRSLRRAIRNGTPPEVLEAGGRVWNWDGSDRPATITETSLDEWHLLLVWQAMCPAEQNNFRIRSRNIKFFSEHLARRFRLPTETSVGVPSASATANCDPQQVTLREAS